MSTARWSMVVAGLALSVFVGETVAQRGIGEPSGVARQADKPELIPLAGKIVSIETGPCERTTGWANVGSHFILETELGERLNVHLGPTAAVEFAIKQLEVGRQAAVQAFRTEGMAEGHYVAQMVEIGDATIKLRDQSLRPLWSRGGGSMGGPVAVTPRSGRGPRWARANTNSSRGYGRRW